MRGAIVDDRLWRKVEALLSRVRRPRAHPQGRRPVDDRKALTGILFVLRTGIPWKYLPREMGCGSGMTCWRRLRDWHAAGVWQGLHEMFLTELNAAHRIDWSRALVDSASVRAVAGGKKDRAEPHGSAKGGIQAPRGHGRPGDASRGQTHGRQRARRHATPPARGLDPGAPRADGTSAQATAPRPG